MFAYYFHWKIFDVNPETLKLFIVFVAREHTTAPAFIQRLAGQCVAEGEPVRLEARVVAAPRATITWKRDSDQVMPDGRVQ